MASTDNPLGKVQNGLDLAVVRRQPNGRGVSKSQSIQGQITSYQSQIIDNNYPGQLAAPSEAGSDKNAFSKSHRVHQNAKAIVRYNDNAKGRVSEGRHAAAVDQIHQNDLHNIEKVSEMPQSTDKYAPGNGIVDVLPDSLYKTAKEPLEGSQQILGGKPQLKYSQDSELVTSFDPIRDRHTWTMWRTAVNGRIVDEVRQLERLKIEKGTANVNTDNSGLYGTALVAPPLRQFIRIDNDESKVIAAHMSSIGQWSLQLPQFVYFGIPRVRMSQPKK